MVTARAAVAAWRPLWLILAVSCWLALPGNLPLWRAVWPLPELAGGRGVVFALGLFVGIAAASQALLSLLAWRGVLRAAMLVLVVISAANSYFMLQYGVVIDATMMANVANTDIREVRDLLSWTMVLAAVLLGVLPAWWLARRRLTFAPAWWSQCARNLAGFAGALAVLLIVALLLFQDLASLMRNHKQVRYMINPLNTLYGSGKLASDQLFQVRLPLQPIGLDAQLGTSHGRSARTPLVVLVVGETARAANFSLGGYARATNPQLQQLAQQGNGTLTYYRDVQACGTSTQVSLPCMFSHLGRQAFEDARQPYENLLDVLQRAGLAVLWIDNQSGCKGVCDRIPHADTAAAPVPALCAEGECFDEVMLQGLEQRLAALDPARRARGVVLVLHQMGSHGPAYYRRSPPAYKKFLPECTSNVLQDCPRSHLVNAYDNTIVYTDHLLAATAQWLAGQARTGAHDTAMVYVSDHGESLGESNLYLHGLPFALAPDTQTHVPMLSWLSDAMLHRLALSPACLQAQAGRPLRHDHLFHTMLGLLDVQTTVYRKDLDWLAACR